MKLKLYEYSQLDQAISFLESLEIQDESTSALTWCMHQIVWHKAVDRVRWLLENKDLVRRIALLNDLEFLQDETLKKEFWESVTVLKRLDK